MYKYVFVELRKKIKLFFWYFLCLSSILMFIELDVYYEATLTTIILVLQFHGFIKWTHLDKNPDNFTWLSFRQKIYVILICLISVIILYFGYESFIIFVNNIIANINNTTIRDLLAHKESYTFVRSPVTHSLIFILSIVAMFLQNYKKIESWVLWIVIDILYLLFFVKTGLGAMIFENVVLIMICLFGFYDWNRKSKLNKKS
ncbi:hypothetical protein CF386_07870 [Paraphotobacterium marinum]|uniref:Nicotinamide riboside transporter PnuC n=1 Tax=Paraphotobacterium marinum TaxID=1755811 RepID=A0A220VFH4_9GAMM|nr:nicotinamide riboside transporter PnuC [Paraphotobacterium marinum]ASK78976.1 hypothetical protein CF386_07870 [Paraphotobacterium marinum]